jgi:hypothetical protein
MRIVAALLAILTLAAHAAESERTLTLPRSLHAGEIAVIELKVGRIARGQEIHITTASGRELGVVSPFGVKSGQAAGTYPIPVPADAVAGRRLTVQVTITGNGAPPRTPTEQEVRSIEIVVGDPDAANKNKKK